MEMWLKVRILNFWQRVRFRGFWSHSLFTANSSSIQGGLGDFKISTLSLVGFCRYRIQREKIVSSSNVWNRLVLSKFFWLLACRCPGSPGSIAKRTRNVSVASQRIFRLWSLILFLNYQANCFAVGLVFVFSLPIQLFSLHPFPRNIIFWVLTGYTPVSHIRYFLLGVEARALS